MDFGKLASVDLVNFALLPEPAQNQQVLPGKRSDNPTLYIGATGYNMKAWVGKWYPVGAKDKSFLFHYGKQFNTIEHNTTHYRIPDQLTIERWRNDTPEDFKFCPKIPQTISHARDLGLAGREIDYFADMIGGLKPQLGPCFMQLPPGFNPDEVHLLEVFTNRFPDHIPLAIEVRHPAFFQPGLASEKYFRLLKEKRIAAVITDVAGRRDVCHMRVTHTNTLIRFVGNGLHPSDYTRIQEWTERLKHWFESGLEAAYFFTHEPDNLLAPELAAYCLENFSKEMPWVTMRGPSPVSGQQGTLF
ncbi:MAG: DUF72 domain-containing protein [Saprospiraceae bacterium]|nr:DUF72 domain-containing protein [Saprospiraceae bacterium]